MAEKQLNIKGEGNGALAFVLSWLLAAVILLPNSPLLDLKAAAAWGLLLAASLGLASALWRGAPLLPDGAVARVLNAWHWSALITAIHALVQPGPRATGSFGNAGYLAAFLILTWPLFLAWQGRARAAALGLLFLALAATQSRAGLLALAAQTAVLGAVAWRRGARPQGRHVLVLLAALAALILRFPPAEWMRATWRGPLWRASLDLFLERPWLGWGWGVFPAEVQGRLAPAMAQALDHGNPRS